MTDLARPPTLDSILRRVAAWPARAATWRARRRSHPAWTVTVAVILAVMLLPIATVTLLALRPEDNIWPHLLRTVLPGSLRDTLLLMAGVGILTLDTLRRGRRYAIVIAFVVAAVLTPPDVISQLMLAVPLIILYEISLIAIRLTQRKPGTEVAAAD